MNKPQKISIRSFNNNKRSNIKKSNPKKSNSLKEHCLPKSGYKHEMCVPQRQSPSDSFPMGKTRACLGSECEFNTRSLTKDTWNRFLKDKECTKILVDCWKVKNPQKHFEPIIRKLSNKFYIQQHSKGKSN